MIGEFFVNLWHGIVANKDTIFTFLSSAEFVTLIGMIWTFIRNAKTNKLNNKALTNTSTKLDDFVNGLTTTNENIDSVAKDIQSLQTQLSALSKQYDKLLEYYDTTSTKQNAILEALSLVYSVSIKDTTLRTNVVGILNNAKHIEIEQISKLREQLEALKNMIAEKTQAVNAEVKEAVQKAEAMIDISEGITTDITRC